MMRAAIHPLAGRGCYASLQPFHLTHAEYVAQSRQQRAERINRKPGHNLQASLAQQLEINRVGTRTECAVHIFFPHLEWNSFVPGDKVYGRPDIGDFIDVKGVDRKGGEMHKKTSLVVQRGGVHPVATWAYVLAVEIELGLIWIAGWLWGFEVAQHPVKELQRNRPSHVAPLKVLHSLRLLQAIACQA